MEIQVTVEEVFSRDGPMLVSRGYLATWSSNNPLLTASQLVRDDEGTVVLFPDRESATTAAVAAAAAKLAAATRLQN